MTAGSFACISFRRYQLASRETCFVLRCRYKRYYNSDSSHTRRCCCFCRKNTVTCEEYNSRVNSLCFYSSLHNVTASLLITLLSVHALAYSSTDRLRKTPTNRPPLVYISIPGLLEASGTFQDILEHSRTFESFAGPPGAGTS